jgi:hypothetical protein
MTARHNFAAGPCPHPDCGGSGTGAVNGWQCAECGHYFPRSQVRMDADSETRCRARLGHERTPPPLFAGLSQAELFELNKLLSRNYLAAQRGTWHSDDPGLPGLRDELFGVLCADVLPRLLV